MSDSPSEREPESERPVVSDTEWEQFQQEAERSVRRPSQAGPVPKEPSARARMVAARLRSEDEAAARARVRRRGRRPKQPEPWQPEGWRTGPAWKGRPGSRRGRWRQSRRVGTVFAVLSVLVGALWLADHRGYLNLGAAGGGDVTPLAAETTRPTGTPPTGLRRAHPTLEHPWAGSPARRWAEGAGAIRVPEAERTGKVPAERMAEALRLTKRYLVAANLDRDVLRGGYPEEALGLIDPLEKEYLSGLEGALRDPSGDGGYDPIVSFTRFDPDEARLVSDTVKVRGRMTVREGEKGRARIEADYSFVYALRPADGGDAVTRVVVRRGLAVDVAPDEGWAGTPGRLWISRHSGQVAGVGCASPDGLLHPAFSAEHDRTDSAGPPEDPYDRSGDVWADTSTRGCVPASRL